MSDDREFAGLSSIRTCPKCGGALEEGLLDAPRGIDWYTHTHTETILSPWHWKMPKLQALRCKKCELVVFLYGKNEGVKP